MHRTMIAGGAAALLLGLATPAHSASHTPTGITVPPDKIVIEVATVNGSGCPEGTAQVAVAPDNTAFTVTYSDYLAQVGSNASPTDFRKNCQLNLRVHVPSGFTYAIVQADYRGYAFLQPGANAIERASYYFQGMPQTTYKSHQFKGPFDDNWQTTDRTEYADLVWAPCGEKRNFNINTELRVNAGTSDPLTQTNFMTMDSTDGSVSTVYHLAWQECPNPA
ncbi:MULTISPECIES: DUF4360 domain-containing protein [unclassified Streptomyces]|uniref:DUF4360 domain-containing protein n=1 Tax=Streptomyces sp. NBC_00180 TaxID=2903632 RepID=A0AAU1IB96_9ACTN|nr:DUF4360 domain-containing protein [Streptomyces sp. NBC_01017]WSV34875.1 DUF4360 domain-containing protein [Streptomyces sp. NBC_01017]